MAVVTSSRTTRTRLDVKRVVAFFLALNMGVYMGLVAFTNWVDQGTNRDFVDHVFAMDTTFDDPDVMGRAIENDTIVGIAYFLIRVTESVVALVLLYAAFLWAREVFRPGDIRPAQVWSTWGYVGVMAIFGFGFITVGGEYFQMWQSEQYNGLQPALQNFIIAGFGLLYTTLVFRSPFGETPDPVHVDDSLASGRGPDARPVG